MARMTPHWRPIWRRMTSAPLPWLNRAPRATLLLNARQRRRIERLYADDFALIESVRAARAKRAKDQFRIAAIAAE